MTLRPEFREFDTVMLTRDLSEAGLRAGDVGTVVMCHSADAVEVEFIDGSGRTRAVVAIDTSDLIPDSGVRDI